MFVLQGIECIVMPTFQYRGARIYYEACGSGPPWILHHGFGQNGRAWAESGWTPALARSFTVVAMDALGHGRSSRGGDPGSYLIPSRAQTVSALAAHMGFDAFGVMGFSLGGRAALELAALQDAGLVATVVIGMKARMTAEDVRRTKPRIRALRSGRVRSLRRQGDNPDENDAESLALTMEGVSRWSGVWERIGQIRAPALLVCGEKDPYFEGAQEAAAAIRHGEFLPLPNVNHDDSFTQSALSLPKVLEFTSRVSGPASDSRPRS